MIWYIVGFSTGYFIFCLYLFAKYVGGIRAEQKAALADVERRLRGE